VFSEVQIDCEPELPGTSSMCHAPGCRAIS